MENKNYITIQGWMVNELNLSGNDLICYALIYGFTQDGETEFRASLSYISCWLNVSKQNARLIIKRLVDKGFVVKRDEIINDVKFCRYKAAMKQPQGGNETATRGSNETATNNNSIDNNNDSKKEEEEKQGWKTNFDAYYQLVVQAQHQLLHDKSCKAQKEKYHPNLDYELSLDKMVTEYWGTEKAWEHKKKSKSKDINMVTTLKKAFDVSSNRVYKKLQFGKGSERRSEPSESKAKNYTNVPLNPELKFVDKEGLLNDGTFVKNGCRYYFSKNQIQTFGIPPAAEPMPNDGNYEYSLEYGWYEVE